MPDEPKEVKKTFWQFLAGFFREAEPESMNRFLSFLFGIGALVFGCLMFSHTKGTNLVNPYEFWLTISFAVIAMLGKNIQKIVEKAADWKFKNKL